MELDSLLVLRRYTPQLRLGLSVPKVAPQLPRPPADQPGGLRDAASTCAGRCPAARAALAVGRSTRSWPTGAWSPAVWCRRRPTATAASSTCGRSTTTRRLAAADPARRDRRDHQRPAAVRPGGLDRLVVPARRATGFASAFGGGWRRFWTSADAEYHPQHRGRVPRRARPESSARACSAVGRRRAAAARSTLPRRARARSAGGVCTGAPQSRWRSSTGPSSSASQRSPHCISAASAGNRSAPFSLSR